LYEIDSLKSHHPPVTAYAIRDTNDGFLLEGYNGQKASISRSLQITVKQVGHATLRFPKFDNETYIITLPALHIEGLISGSPYVELSGHSSIVSTSGYVGRIDYAGRGWLSGKKNSFVATLSKTSDPKKTLYQADGQWTGSFVIKDTTSKETVESWDPTALPQALLTVAPIESQVEYESRRAWAKVAEAIKKGDMDATQREKGIIENRQRELRKKEEADGREWERKYFRRERKDDLFEKLGSEVGEHLEPEKTDGVWVFVGGESK
jgi:oxysterol-binding protein-related protein 9/10/11